MIRLRFDELADRSPYHAALVSVGPGRDGRVLPHTHADFYDLLYVVAGHGTHTAGETTHPLKAGELILVRPSDRHSFTGRGPKGLQFVNIAFPTTTWHAFTDLMAINAARAWDCAGAPPHVALDNDEATLAAEFQRILQTFHEQPRTLDLARLWSHIVPCLHPDEFDRENAPLPGWLADACSAMAIEENLRAGLPRLLQLAAVSHGHLDRTMRAHFGSTPIGYITERRLARAALLLATTTETVARIASRCGFTSVSYLGRRFRERYGTNPREYRRTASRVAAPAGMQTPHRAGMPARWQS